MSDLVKKENEETGLTLAAPSFMGNDAGVGIKELSNFIVPPRIKIVQKQASEELLSKFAKSSVILSPQGIVVAGPAADGKTGDPFYLIPLLFFPEWGTLNPYQLKGQLPMFRERTRDPKHLIAVKARKVETRTEECPENSKFEIRHTEFLNFICALIGDCEYAGLPVALSFSRGDHRAGTNFAALLQARCGRPNSAAPIYGCVFRANVSWRPGSGKGDFYGIDVNNPTREDVLKGIKPFVQDQTLYEKLKATHATLNEQIGNIVVEHDAEDVLDVPSSTVDDEMN